VRPVRGGLAALQQARLGELEGAGAQGCEPLAGLVGLLDGGHDPRVRLVRRPGPGDHHRVGPPDGVEPPGDVQVEANRTVVVTVAAGAAVSVAFYSMVFVFSLFFQQVQGRSALYAGLMFLPMTGLIGATNLVAGKLAGRYGARRPMVIGQSVAVVGLLILLYVGTGTPSGLVAVLLVPLALGCALTVPPLTAAMLEAVPAERAGLAAGVLNAARQVAGGLGIAVFGTLVSGGFVTGMRVGLVVSAALLALTGALSFRLAGRGASRA
jgi:DHA2 family methylenomycin A resistance protein-like MFS transporter